MMQHVAVTQPPRFVPFGKYLLLERIAIGGMAEVYLAKSFESGHPSELLAVKRILPSLAADQDFIRMFLDEAKIAGGLTHPGIVQIRELGRIGAAHYLAMDFVWGKDLLQIARRCRLLGTQLSPAFVAWVGAGICEALAYAHEKRDRRGEPMNLIHRDISPQNVLVSFDGKVKLIDFGIAKAQSRTTQTQAGVLKGKVGYMSPEQVRGEALDPRSDLFAVGTSLYELLTLRSLFARENTFETMENVKDVRARPVRELRPDVPEELERILSRALTLRREDRWQSARELQHALLGFLNLVEPGFDRVAAVTWIRDAFRKELHAERVRLEAFDQIGRPQIAPADEPRRHSVTDLEITGIGGVPPPDWDEEGETLVYAEPIPFVDSEPPDPGPSEVFFRSQIEKAANAESERAASPSSSPRLQAVEPTTRPAELPPPPVGLLADGDVSLAPAQINSGIIRQLMPTGDEKSTAAREPTTRHRYDRQSDADPPRRRKKSMAGSIAAAVALLVVGAVAAYAYVTMAADAQIEVRTTPDVGAIVLLDGAARGTAPLRLERVRPGRHVLTLVADGYEDVRREIELGPNGAAVIDVVLTPRTGPP
jgi:serine/threonine protein kinase